MKNIMFCFLLILILACASCSHPKGDALIIIEGDSIKVLGKITCVRVAANGLVPDIYVPEKHSCF
jgi:hypothetical protein